MIGTEAFQLLHGSFVEKAPTLHHRVEDLLSVIVQAFQLHEGT